MIIPRYIHVAANGVISFFFMTEQYSIACVDTCIHTHMNTYIHTYIVFIQCSVRGHLGRFHVLAVVNSAR